MEQTQTHPIHSSIVLVGGGHSHIGVIRHFAMNPIQGVQITVISQDIHTPYSGMLPGLIAGHYQFDDCHIDLRKLCQWANIRLIHGIVEHIDPQLQHVTCSNRPDIRYDMLSVNTGSEPNLSAIEGSEFGHGVKPINKFVLQWNRWLKQYPFDITPNICVVGGGAASVEVALAMHHRLMVLGHKAKIILVCANSKILAGHNQKVARYFAAKLKEHNIETRYGQAVKSANASSITLADGSTIDSDFTAWVIDAKAKSWLSNTGLSCNERGFINVDRYLRSTSHSNVFASGDTINFEPKNLPKAGVYAVRQGLILAHNINASLTNKTLKAYKPQQRFMSLLATGGKHAVLSWGQLFIAGSWIWRWKNQIDQNFMARFTPPKILIESNPMRCGGCGAKVGSNVLHNVISQLDIKPNVDVVAGLATSDDCAIINIPTGMQWVQTVDFFKAFIDDPYLLGRIGANHCLSDIHAMGAKPHSALATVTIPHSDDKITEDNLLALMQGALATLNLEQTTLIGGHTGEGLEVGFGLTVNGIIEPNTALTKAGLCDGDHLILTKPLGSGVLLAANMQNQCEGRWLEAAIEQMLKSNQRSAATLKQHGAKACTDITGFGLLGHLLEMLDASNLSAQLSLSQIPVLAGALNCLDLGIQSTLTPQNQRNEHRIDKPNLTHPNYPLLFDPQTSGGLLSGVNPTNSKACLMSLASQGYSAAIIGTVRETDNIEVTLEC